MNNYLIDCEVRPQDVENVRNLIADTGVFSEEEIKISAELVEETLANTQDYQFVFLRDNDELAAYTCFGPICLTDKRYDLYWIGVAKKYQNQKLASLVLQETEKKIRQQGGVRLYAETSSLKAYIPARSFYLNKGFKKAAQIKDFYKDGDDKVIFCKKLVFV